MHFLLVALSSPFTCELKPEVVKEGEWNMCACACVCVRGSCVRVCVHACVSV